MLVVLAGVLSATPALALNYTGGINSILIIL